MIPNQSGRVGQNGSSELLRRTWTGFAYCELERTFSGPQR